VGGRSDRFVLLFLFLRKVVKVEEVQEKQKLPRTSTQEHTNTPKLNQHGSRWPAHFFHAGSPSTQKAMVAVLQPQRAAAWHGALS